MERSLKNKYQRIKLPYEMNDLEPIISYQTMYWHYNFFHRNYEIKLNEVLAGTETEKKYPFLEKLMVNLNKLPFELKEDVRFFGGGLINHNFFFRHLTKPNSLSAQEKNIDPRLSDLIQEFLQSQNLLRNTLSLQDLSPLEKLKKELVKKALEVRGSGWTWLVLNQNNQLQIINTANQDGPWALGYRPLIAIDVWEHAYFLDYHNNRQMYVEKLVNHLLNWEYISWLYVNYLESPSPALL
ncbi:MAG: superoxide dismutase [Candidatus Moeniiplasma glomeromycotorum]|nr:superoxide dismutase [Candidatus Moeniiplasma glomeromycotorum]MCE8167430.1 superoxide dismutase [Candidatus Moeniiplasma glomeromycotorum]MCE8168556.1 superoxide dismutase [Candidatus Moeniiplasma glomeromycotorum]